MIHISSTILLLRKPLLRYCTCPPVFLLPHIPPADGYFTISRTACGLINVLASVNMTKGVVTNPMPRFIAAVFPFLSGTNNRVTSGYAFNFHWFGHCCRPLPIRYAVSLWDNPVLGSFSSFRLLPVPHYRR